MDRAVVCRGIRLGGPCPLNTGGVHWSSHQRTSIHVPAYVVRIRAELASQQYRVRTRYCRRPNLPALTNSAHRAGRRDAGPAGGGRPARTWAGSGVGDSDHRFQVPGKRQLVAVKRNRRLPCVPWDGQRGMPEVFGGGTQNSRVAWHGRQAPRPIAWLPFPNYRRLAAGVAEGTTLSSLSEI